MTHCIKPHVLMSCHLWASLHVRWWHSYVWCVAVFFDPCRCCCFSFGPQEIISISVCFQRVKQAGWRAKAASNLSSKLKYTLEFVTKMPKKNESMASGCAIVVGVSCVDFFLPPRFQMGSFFEIVTAQQHKKTTQTHTHTFTLNYKSVTRLAGKMATKNVFNSVQTF